MIVFCAFLPLLDGPKTCSYFFVFLFSAPGDAPPSAGQLNAVQFCMAIDLDEPGGSSRG